MEEVGIELRNGVTKASCNTFMVCNLKVYVYGLDRIQTHDVAKLTVLSIVHPRGRDYRYSEVMAHELLHYYYSHGGTEDVIAVTFDLWNHGNRLTDDDRNVDWKSGNPNHAQDMMAQIEGSAYEVGLVMDFLPAYLPVNVHASNVRHVVTGVSLGGHISWRVAQHRGRKRLEAMAPVIGSPYMTNMLLERLKLQVPGNPTASKSSSTNSEPSTVSAKIGSKAACDKARACLGVEASKLWPDSVHELLLSLDSPQVDKGIKVLMCNGEIDSLVPAKYSAGFFDEHQSDPDIELFVQPETPHTCSPEMLDLIGHWLVHKVII